MRKIVTGGQTGVDRAAFDVGLVRGIDIGGWCPRGRRAEDGAVPMRYSMHETFSDDYASRTRRNVEESDGLLLLHEGILDEGSIYAVETAEMLGKPVRQVNIRDQVADQVPEIYHWIQENQISILNVGGPRESSNPGIHQKARIWLECLADSITQDAVHSG